ncbi:MAG: family 10 glycosylhydrolase [Phycisphaerae bacterium]|jgi:uncharacterized lipoprotein YddW (UPF0748 family)|nr:family 10 glycosylhydrolase [Phycisphaerae bacterium]MCZ2399872.1 family 10 glycosylhydrolase [Phycisphaerae bacterium]
MPREFRGVWVATVDNINWPSRPGLPTAQQQHELRGIIRAAARARCNAIVLQVRPACDALYASSLDPWSEYLSGAIGRPPTPAWDPLSAAIDEAHACGLELHAWVNPFRARHRTNRTPPSSDHVVRRRPEWVRAYGPELWLDPGEAEARQYVLAVARDLVRRYDLDGLHLDDYFYPYPAKDASGRPLTFPDHETFQRYRAAGGTLARADWRRANVDTFVEQLYRTVKDEKPWVRVGISPFGIWRPGNPRGVVGLDAYHALSADARRWLAEGWIDYLAPQLYWRLDATGQRFEDLLDWWLAQNALGRHVWPGLNASRVLEAGPQRWPATEIVAQIEAVRRRPNADGHLLYHADAALGAASPLNSTLSSLYRGPALAPASPWLHGPSALRRPPTLSASQRWPTGDLVLEWRSDEPPPRFWLLRWRSRGRWLALVLGGHSHTHALPARDAPAPDMLSLCAVDHVGRLGPAVVAVP